MVSSKYKKKDFLIVLIFSGEDLYVFGSIVRKLRVEEEGRVVSSIALYYISLAVIWIGKYRRSKQKSK